MGQRDGFPLVRFLRFFRKIPNDAWKFAGLSRGVDWLSQLPGAILEAAMANPCGLHWWPFSPTKTLDQGQDGLPDVFRQDRPALDYRGQVGVVFDTFKGGRIGGILRSAGQGMGQGFLGG
jgi:hypothetical protein